MIEKRTRNLFQIEAFAGTPLRTHRSSLGQDPKSKCPFKEIDSGKETNLLALLIRYARKTLPQFLVPIIAV
jgi:hypothetical protein